MSWRRVTPRIRQPRKKGAKSSSVEDVRLGKGDFMATSKNSRRKSAITLALVMGLIASCAASRNAGTQSLGNLKAGNPAEPSGETITALNDLGECLAQNDAASARRFVLADQMPELVNSLSSFEVIHQECAEPISQASMEYVIGGMAEMLSKEEGLALSATIIDDNSINEEHFCIISRASTDLNDVLKGPPEGPDFQKAYAKISRVVSSCLAAYPAVIAQPAFVRASLEISSYKMLHAQNLDQAPLALPNAVRPISED